MSIVTIIITTYIIWFRSSSSVPWQRGVLPKLTQPAAVGPRPRAPGTSHQRSSHTFSNLSTHTTVREFQTPCLIFISVKISQNYFNVSKLEAKKGHDCFEKLNLPTRSKKEPNNIHLTTWAVSDSEYYRPLKIIVF